MRLLLDECLPRRLKQSLVGHDVATVPEMGWASIKNGVLLKLAESQADVFITMDGSLQYQQNLQDLRLSFVLLAAPNNTIEALQPLVPKVLEVLQSIQPGQIVRIEAERR